jgi:hypothetical protein
VLADLQYGIGRIASGIAADWSVYVRYLATGEELALDADRLVDTMSVIKVPLLVTLFRAAEAGQADLDRRITLEDHHKRFGTGVLRTLDDGLVLTLRDAAMLMIIQSDNTATDLCFEAVGGPEAVTRTMRDLGLPSIQPQGTAFDWFRALAASMDPALATLSPGELFSQGYPDLPPRELAQGHWRGPLALEVVTEEFEGLYSRGGLFNAGLDAASIDGQPGRLRVEWWLWRGATRAAPPRGWPQQSVQGVILRL